MSFSTIGAPDSHELLTYLKAVYPYSEIPNKSPSTTSTPDFVELSKDSKKISKISRHFEGIQKSILSTPRGEIWQWIEMRYHVEKLHHHLREGSSREHLPTQKNGQTFANLFPKKRLEINEFIQDIKGLTLRMQQVIDLPIQPGQNGAFRATPCYGSTLKIFFDQFPKLNILKNFDDTKGKNNKVMDFWKLYLELHKNYSNKSRQTKYNFNTAKLSHLCNELLAPQRNYGQGDVEGALTQFPGVNTHFKGILGVFSNPFDPKLNEILQFDFYLDNISDALETHRKNVASQTSSQSDRGFLSSWW
jgi:hypothetical protein